MKTYFLSILLPVQLLFCAAAFSQNNSVGIGTLSPNPSSLLDIDASPDNNKGLLIPRLTAVQRLSIVSPANSLMVFDTDSACFFYWSSVATNWKSMCSVGLAGPAGAMGSTGATGAVGVTGNTGATGPSGPAGVTGATGTPGIAGVTGVTGATGSDLGTHWIITGNAGTNSATNFIGTTDPVDWVVKTNNNERMRVLTNGTVGIGTSSPNSFLHAAGQINTGIPFGGLGGASAQNGAIAFYNPANTNTVTMQSGSTISSYVLTLPDTQGAVSSFLKNDGSGNLSWETLNLGGWFTTGNGGTTASTSPIGSAVNNNFIGTTDANDFVLATDNIERLRVTAAGKTGLGTAAPTRRFTVYDDAAAIFSSAGTNNNSYYVSATPVLAVSTDGNNASLSGAYLDNPLFIVGRGGGINGPTEQFLRVNLNGNVGVHTTLPAYTLDVCGDIRAQGSVYYGGTCSAADGTDYTKPDYVFKDGYKIYSVDEVEKFISKRGHLPWLTSAQKEKEENEGGAVNITRMSFETLEAVENMQLQIIELKKEIERLKKECAAK
ncbi:MAG: hypothetical protein WAQ28_13425 [Bacteroidia bacterium]